MLLLMLLLLPVLFLMLLLLYLKKSSLLCCQNVKMFTLFALLVFHLTVNACVHRMNGIDVTVALDHGVVRPDL